MNPSEEPIAPDPEDEELETEAPAPDAEDADAASTDEAGPRRRHFILRRNSLKRLDIYLHNRLKGISRNKIQQLIELGGVTVNGKTPKASTLLKLNDEIDVILPPPAIREITPEPIPLTVLYEDDAFIVLNKQANLIVHPARGMLNGTLVNALAYHFKAQLEIQGQAWKQWQTRGFKDKDQPSSAAAPPRQRDGLHNAPLVPGLSAVGANDLRPGIVHRLDKNTTGVMVVAKCDQAHWQIARQFEDRSTLKAYLAVVHGNFKEPGGCIDEPLGKHPTLREAYAVRRDSQGKHAVTLFRVREQYQGYALVELELKTGRTHQIRVHLSYLGHPIVGDIIYGGEPIGTRELDQPPIPAGGRPLVTYARERDEGLRIEAKAKARPDLILAHPALHAAFLRFRHPFTKQDMTFTAPVHEPMRTLIGLLRQRPSSAPVSREGYWIDLTSAVPN